MGYICIQTFCIHFVYKRIQNVYENLQKCGIHFVYKQLVYILYTSLLIYLKHIYTSQTLCIQFEYKFIQNVYTNNCMQNGSLTSTWFDPFVVHFLVNHCKQLRLETCWLIMGGTYQINGLLDYIFHQIAGNQIEQIQILRRIWKNTPNLCS